MTTLNTIIEEEKKEFAEKIDTICKQADQYQINAGYPVDVPAKTIILSLLTSAMQREYEAGRADWLRSEIEKLEGVAMKNTKDESTSDWFYGYGWNQALTSIITRYKEELLELEKGV